ncbi:MAG: hypothetical protein GEU81_04005 [Nitriliruptorales bacterium]|nr:hypothetical protein [Nitriliruptorales bacterium]
MARADLHDALALDSEIYEASRVDPSLLDPVVRVDGGLPGVARPAMIMRRYQGPQGSSTEYFTIADDQGRERFRSSVRRIHLSGEMFEDQFVDTVRGLRIDSNEEHSLTFFVNDEEVASIPVFIEAGLGGDPWVALEQTFTKALQKGSILWLEVPQPRDRRGRDVDPHQQPVWFVLDSGKVYVLSGPGEQQVPNLGDVSEVKLTVRSKDHRSRIVQVPASVRVVPPDDALFNRIGRSGLGKRLNLRDGDEALERWRANCTMVELTARFRPAGSRPPQPRAAAPAAAGAGADAGPAAATAAGEGNGAPKMAEDDIHVEAQLDQEVFDQLIAEGKSERVARAKAKAAYVRREKARIRADREQDKVSS